MAEVAEVKEAAAAAEQALRGMEQDMEAMTEDMEAKAGERMDALQAELASALDERAAWLTELRESRDAQQQEKRAADAMRAAREAEARELAALRRECDELRTQMAALVGHQNHKQKIQYTMRLKQDNSALKLQQQATAEELTKARKLVERLRSELERQQRRAAHASSDTGSVTASETGSVRGGKQALGKPPPLPFDFEEEQRLEAALEAERAERGAEQQRFATFVAEVGQVAGVTTSGDATAPSPPQVLARLRERASEQEALAEQQRFELQLAKKEKGMLESRAMLGRRHRAPSGASALGAPTDKENAPAGGKTSAPGPAKSTPQQQPEGMSDAAA